MMEDLNTLPVSNGTQGNGSTTKVDHEFLSKYSFGRRVPRKLVPYYNKNFNRFKIAPIGPIRSLKKVSDTPSIKKILVESACVSEGTISIETSEKESCSTAVPQAEVEATKSAVRSPAKVELTTDAAILKSVLRPRMVPVPPEKVGLVREPQVIVRKFNIPMLCPQSSKFTKLKERWKYQHDVVGLTNVNPNNPLHKLLKSKPVVSYTVSSFVNDTNKSKPTTTTSSPASIVETTSSLKLTTNAILPKNHIAGPSRFVSSSSTSSLNVPPNSAVSLPSTTPPAVVKLKPVPSTTPPAVVKLKPVPATTPPAVVKLKPVPSSTPPAVVKLKPVPSSTPPAVVKVKPVPSTPPPTVVKGKPVEVLANMGSDTTTVSSASKSQEFCKYLILTKPIQDSQTSTTTATTQESGKANIEATFANQKPTQIFTTSSDKLSKSNTIVLQGNSLNALGLDKEAQSGMRVINPFAVQSDVSKSSKPSTTYVDSNQQSDANKISALRNSLLGIPLVHTSMTTDTHNTIHLEILSGDTVNLNPTQEITVETEPTSTQSTLVPANQEESIRRAATPHPMDPAAGSNAELAAVLKSADARTFSKPMTVFTVPISASGAISQLLMKSRQQKDSRAPITVQTATPAPQVVASTGEQMLKTFDTCSLQSQVSPTATHTIALAPLVITSSGDVVPQKPKTSDVVSLQGEDVAMPVVKPTMVAAPLVMTNAGDVPQQKVKSELLVLKPLQQQNGPVSSVTLTAPLIVTSKGDTPQQKMKNEVMVLKPIQYTNGAVQTAGTGEVSKKKKNLTLLSTRQTIALQYQRDMLKTREEIRTPRFVSYLARTVQLLDSSTQTSLFSLLEPGRLVEMTFSGDPKGNSCTSVQMPSPTMQSAAPSSSSTTTTTNKPAGSCVATAKHIVSVDSSGRVKVLSSPCSSSEPMCKKLRLDQSLEAGAGNIFKLLCPPVKLSLSQTKQLSTSSDSSSQNNKNNINKPPVKNINEMLKLDNIFQHSASMEIDYDSKISTKCPKLDVGGLEAMITDTDSNDVIVNRPKLPPIDNKQIIHRAYNDWLNCLVPDEDGNIPLHHAVLDEDLNRVKGQCFVLSARNASIDVHNVEKQTPLHLAIWLGLPDIVQTLLKFRARPDVVDINGNTALHLATEKTSNFNCMEAVLDGRNCKRLLNLLNYDGYSPLHLCALNNKGQEMIALVKKGANVNLRDGKSGRTALFHTVEAHDSKLSRILVQYGASASVTNFAGQTPLLATNDMSMLGDRAMSSVIMARNSLRRSEAHVMEDAEDDDSADDSGSLGPAWKMFEQEDR